jgi:hypothetical protein
MADTEEHWTKWWWVTYFADFRAWTAEERNVRLALGLSTIPVMLLVCFITAALLRLLGVEQHVAAILAGAISTVAAFLAARPIAMVLYPDSLQKADENSKKAAGRIVPQFKLGPAKIKLGH